MAKVIITALHNLPKLVTEENSILWKEAQLKAKKRTVKELKYHYEIAHKILTNRA